MTPPHPALFLACTVAAAFLLGSIPSGFLVAKARGVDIRQHGSGNIGATNVLRTLGKGPGLLVFALDLLKGLGAVVAAKFFATSAWDAPVALPASAAGITAAVAAILGHNYTPWLGFKGGKGIATSAGVLLGLMPLVLAVGLAVWAAVFLGTRYVSLASIAAALSLPVTTATLVFSGRADPPLLAFAAAAAALAVFRHRSNIRRLMDGTESRFTPKPKPSSTHSP
jgi:glycerol-3-phosphate acyltransferase PlsY